MRWVAALEWVGSRPASSWCFQVPCLPRRHWRQRRSGWLVASLLGLLRPLLVDGWPTFWPCNGTLPGLRTRLILAPRRAVTSISISFPVSRRSVSNSPSQLPQRSRLPTPETPDRPKHISYGERGRPKAYLTRDMFSAVSTLVMYVQTRAAHCCRDRPHGMAWHLHMLRW